jgi:hypothetical protein
VPRSRPARTSFVAGEWSPLLHGRSDIQKYVQAAASIENWLVQPQGGITRRPGSRYVTLTKAQDYDPVLLPFVFGPSQSYVLEFGEQYVRYFTLQGQLRANVAAAGIVNGDFAAGMTGWTDTSVSGGTAAVTNGDVLVQGDVGTPVGTLTDGGGLSAPFGGLNTANFFAYHRLSITGGDATLGIGISRVIFYEDNQTVIDPVTGTPLGNLTANPPSNNTGPFQAIKNIPWTNAAQSAGTPALTGMHWSFRTHKVTGFQVYGSSDKGFKFGDDPDITVQLQGSSDNFVTEVATLATVVHHSASNIPAMVELFADNIPGDWINCARSASTPAWIGKHWPAAKTITGFTLRSSDDHGFKKDENPSITFTLQGSNDNFATNSDLATLTITDNTGSTEASIRRRIAGGSFAYHRILMAGGLTSSGFAVKQVIFYEAGSDIGRMRLTPNAGTAAVDQTIAIPAGEIGQPHLLAFRVIADQGAECTVRVGSASDLYDYTGSIIKVGDGGHTISFLPTSASAVLQFRSLGDDVVDIDSVTLLSDQPLEVSTPYSRGNLRALSVAQAADVMWIAHPQYQLRQLIRHGHTSWELRAAKMVDGPYLDVNLDDSIVITPSAASGAAITLTASEALFKPGHIGSLWRLCAPGGVPGSKTWEVNTTVTLGEHRKFGRNVYKNAGAAGTTGNSPPIHDRGTVSDGGVNWLFRNQDGWGYVLITGYTSPTVVTAKVRVLLDPAVTSGTAVWREGAFSDARGWPEVVALVGDRLLLARGIEFYLSSVGIFDDFTPTGDDDGAIYGQLSGSIGAPIRWAVGQQRILIGTEAGPWVLRSSGEDEALTPKNIQARQQNAAGSSEIPAFQAEGSVLYFSRSERRMHELTPAIDQTGGIGYRGTDMTILGSRALGPGAVRGWPAREPQSVVWVVRHDGQVATLTYSQAESVVAWSRQLLGGRVASHAIIPGSNDSQALDEIWLCVDREVAGGNRYIEYIVANIGGEPEAPEDSFYVDCGVRSDPTRQETLYPEEAALTVGNIAHFGVSADIFAPEHVGRLIRQTRSVGLGEIVSVPNSHEILCEIIRPFDTTAPIPGTFWGLSSQTFTGLDHLEGSTVRILTDGAEHPDLVVSGGAITLQHQAFEVVAGLAITSRYEGLSTAEGAASGTSVGAFKRTSNVIIGMVNSGDFDVGFITDSGRDEELQEVILRRAEEPISFQPPPLQTGITEPLALNMPHDRDPRLLIVCDGARPATVTHVVFSDMSVEELA